MPVDFLIFSIPFQVTVSVSLSLLPAHTKSNLFDSRVMNPRMNRAQAMLPSVRPYRPQWHKNEAVQKIPATPAPPKGQLLLEIDCSDLKEFHYIDGDCNSRITKCTDLASYTWLNKTSPTIIIPGIQVFLS